MKQYEAVIKVMGENGAQQGFLCLLD